MKPDYYFLVADPQILGNPGGKQIVLRFQTVETKKGVPARSGKHIHLEMTVAFAMQVLGNLQALQASGHLPAQDPGPATEIQVPPAKDRN
jgi:hypothetical protein